jgi:hypothetical protein
MQIPSHRDPMKALPALVAKALCSVKKITALTSVAGGKLETISKFQIVDDGNSTCSPVGLVGSKHGLRRQHASYLGPKGRDSVRYWPRAAR